MDVASVQEETEDAARAPGRAGHVIVLGNEKGGSGKSTLAMHIMVALLRRGHQVGAVDLDARQRTLGRYLENRRALIAAAGLDLPMPEVHAVDPSERRGRKGEDEARARLEEALRALRRTCAYIVIDSPGAYTTLSRVAHALADTLVTPLNESFVDLDLLAEIDPETLTPGASGAYARMVAEGRANRRETGQRGGIDWVVLLNRMAPRGGNSRRRILDALETLSQRLDFRLVPGLGERLVYRELFPHGLTLLDLGEPGVESAATMGHVSAGQDLARLLEALRLPVISHQRSEISL
jgi:chromosome partitioning protein